jgi:hypothetical protein
MADNKYGLVAVFEHPGQIMHAAERIRDAGFKRWDVITPFPIHGMDQAMGMGRSKVPFFAFIGGMTGFLGGNAMIAWMNAINYPLIVHGKPYYSPLVAFPVSYELTILLAAFGSIIGMFIMNRLPMHYHPVLKWDKAHYGSDNKFLLIIEASDPKFDRKRTQELLASLGSTEIEELEA